VAVQYRAADFDSGRVEAVLFDIDGTLVDTDDLLVERVARYLNWLFFFAPTHDVLRTARRLVMASETPTNYALHVLDRTGLDRWSGALMDQLHHWRGDRSQNEARLVPEAFATLESLAAHFSLAVVTARENRSTLSILQELNLSHYFECVVTARTCRYSKPHPAPVLWAAKQLDCNPGHCLMVGDTTVDILSGKRAGTQTVGVLSGFGEGIELRKVGADLIMDNVGDLPGLLLPESTPPSSESDPPAP
jgi:HAD superfamily hydrolase (TIGR01509 family)